MIQEILKFISNINIGYITFILLFLMVSLLFLSTHKINNILKEIYIIIYVTIAWIGFYYLNDIFNNIFTLKYLSVKLYLILLIIGNIIMLITINKRIPKSYKITNYIIFTINIIIFTINIFIMLSNKTSNFIIASTEEITKLININFIAFIIYLNMMCIIYIINYSLKLKIKQPTIVEANKNSNNIQIEVPFSLLNKKEQIAAIDSISTNQSNQNGFYIDGVDCSIIFEEENRDTILKNYYILLNDVNAKLINGYTISENIKLKKIFNKLNIKDLNNISLDVNKLSQITIDEYNLLKRYINTKNKSF